jgi:hypothetical protein
MAHSGAKGQTGVQDSGEAQKAGGAEQLSGPAHAGNADRHPVLQD